MAQPTLRVQLRNRLTPFGQQVAAVVPPEPDNGLRFRSISEVEAIDVMRRLLARYGLEVQQAIRQGDGSRRPTWYEAPEIWIKRWVNSETAIVVKDTAEGPVGLEFDMRIASDTFKVVYRIGDAPGHAALLAAYWDLGIRRSIWEFTDARTPKDYVERVQARYAAMAGCTLTMTPRDAGVVDYALTMMERPITR